MSADSAVALARLDLLCEVLSQPTAPFREKHALACLTRALESGAVPHFRDPIGNLVVGAGSRAEYARLLARKDREPVRFFVAHTDHPGFHGTSWRAPDELEFKWHGGSPLKHFEGATVWLATAEGSAGEGTVLEAKLTESGRALDRGVVRVPSELRTRFPRAAPSDIYGGFGFRAPWWIEGRLIHTKAADDLVGAFAIVSTSLDLFAKRRRGKAPPFLALLSRAEEVGFIGTIGHLELGWLGRAKRSVLGVSLETSKTLPGAEIGQGPVVRLGDRMTTFDSGATRVFTGIAEKKLPGRHQRRIMDGGSCEASALTAYGIPCVGISVPLGNYHNQSFQGGPDSRGPDGPAPEFVHLDDVQGLLTLCGALMEPGAAWDKPWMARRQDFKKSLLAARALLKAGP